MLFKNCLIAQAEITRKIDRFDVRGQARNYVHRLPVREREENAIDTVEILRRRYKTELGEAVEISMYFTYLFARLFVSRDENHFDVRMKQQDTEKL